MEIGSYLSKNQQRRKRRRKYIAIAVLFVIAYFIATGAFWLVYRSPMFQLQHVVVTGDAGVASSDVVAVLQTAALQKRNFFKELLGYGNILLWPNTLATSDLALLPQVQSITISKNYFFRTVTANVTERAPMGVWCFMPKTDASGYPVGSESCYLFDAQGTMFQRAFDTQGGLLFSVHDHSQTGLGLGAKILPAEFIPNMLSILNDIQKSGLDPEEIALNDLSLEQINVTTHNGPAVYFSLRFSADEDLPVLQSIMAQPGFGKLQYIDFTVENRAYYK
jgi:hypothetical protein